jgi:hypothetical protein
MTSAWEAATRARDPLDALRASRSLAGHLSGWEAHLVDEATGSGATWEAVGGAVGVSRQAAWERFHTHVGSFRKQIKAESRELAARHRQEVADFRQSVKQRSKGIGTTRGGR